jgi:DNA-binding winged helix-turn-helix (wHTH) protein/tetratricopeptide (TPR) repeat protein
MSATSNSLDNQLLEFGRFQIDPVRHLLLGDGRPIPLDPKTFQILLVMVRHANQTVTKEELMQAVWPDTFIDESNLIRNISGLRSVLGETELDRYIVTVPGQGYRLVLPVRVVSGPQQVTNVAAGESTIQAQKALWRRGLLIGLLVLAVGAGLALLFRNRIFWNRTPTDAQKQAIVIADFANSSGDPVFDGTLRQGVSVELEQSPGMSVISEDRIQRTLQLMGHAPDAKLTPEIAREICERVASTILIDGSISVLGSGYVLSLRAKNCQTGETLSREQAEAPRKEDVLHTLDTMAGALRSRIGDSAADIQKHNVPLESATTASLDALKWYSQGVQLNLTAGPQMAILAMKRAVEIDPQFAMAFASLGLFYSNMGEPELAAQMTARAYELRQRVSDRERFCITALYDRQVTGNLDKEAETLELWVKAYPNDLDAHGLLAGFATVGRGLYDTSIQESQRALAIDPDFTFGYVMIASSNLYQDRLEPAQVALEQGEQRFRHPDLLNLRYYLSFLTGDASGMERTLQVARQMPGAEDQILHSMSLTAASSGHFAEARVLAGNAAQLAQQLDQNERAGLYEASVACWEALIGNKSNATERALAALKLSKGRDVEYGAAFALSVVGDSRGVALADDLKSRFPENTSVTSSYLPTLSALQALSRHDPLRAIETLEEARRIENAIPRIAYDGFFGAMNPIYVRGQAYLMLGQPANAAAEFNKIVHARGRTLADPIGPISRLQLGRAYEMSNNSAGAREAYQAFLAGWRDADPGIPIYSQAQSEYMSLQPASFGR